MPRCAPSLSPGSIRPRSPQSRLPHLRPTTTSVAPGTTSNPQHRRIIMLTHPTLDQMAALGLTGMADAWKALAEQDPGQALDRNEWLGLMLDREATARADKRFGNRLRNAKMRFPNACIEDVSFAASRGIDPVTSNVNTIQKCHWFCKAEVSPRSAT